ncbi:MAG: twin-arginine translocation signal domain-containing protein, partial [Sulfurovum sp.]|nr:twin-arginine translocation signal domain-containing protein [Sulfurovum sp.]
MTKSMKNDNTNFIESRRSFLKGTAYSVAGATLAAGVFEAVVATPAEAD